ncbi:unnamed protein product [Ranitomeya imitator]|uniref:C2H2-type domain-containing protein n=1 Tax=Ranitomeya imitator TaxID=111125 RepID=A0ABN9MD68_9NEOB|nr:unnamed protein product [Ranitomeya imitator]
MADPPRSLITDTENSASDQGLAVTLGRGLQADRQSFQEAHTVVPEPPYMADPPRSLITDTEDSASDQGLAVTLGRGLAVTLGRGLQADSQSFQEALQTDVSLEELRCLADRPPAAPDKERVYWDQGRLYTETIPTDTTESWDYERRLIVPYPFREQLLRIAHEIPLAGHLGIQKTKARLTHNFYWPKMGTDIANYCRSCVVCQRAGKSGNIQKAPLIPLPVIDEPFQRVAVDIIGPLAIPSSSGKKYILTVVDYATRYPEAAALSSIRADKVADALLTVFSRLDNLVLINKIKEQLMAEKIRPPHLPPTSVPSQQPLLVPPSPRRDQPVRHVPAEAAASPWPAPASGSPARCGTARPARHQLHHRAGAVVLPRSNISTSESGTSGSPSTPTSSSQTRLIATSPTLISGFASSPMLDSIKTIQGHSLLGPTKPERGRKKIKAENPPGPPVLVVPYPILASGDIGKEGKTYRCKVCPLTFFTKSEMQIHSKSHTEAKPHKCPHCSKSFANASYLAQHLRIHLGVKPYHCSYCEKSFRQLSHLQQHTRIHTGDRPYKCPQPACEKAFTQLSNLQSHQRQHNKDKPYKCPNCYRAYTDSASLQIHLSAHAVKHAKAYCCSMCGRAYTSETYLMKHMSKHTVVEHLVNHHSPQRTESPGIPVRISLI